MLAPDVAPAVDAIVMKALAKNPDNRYQTAAEMQADITRALAGRPVLATPGAVRRADPGVYAPRAETTAMTVRPARRTHPILRGLVYLLLFGAVGGIVFVGVYKLHQSFGDARPTARVEVPDLTGLTKDAAIAKLLAGQLRPRRPDRQQQQAGRHGLLPVTGRPGGRPARQHRHVQDQPRCRRWCPCPSSRA